MLWKKCINIHCEKKILWSWPIWKNCSQETTVEEAKQSQRLQLAKAHKDWTTEQWNKVLWTNKSNFEIFGSNSRVYVWRRVGEGTATFSIIVTTKHRGGYFMVCVCVWGGGGGFCQLQSWGFVPGEGQIESDQLSQHTAALHNPIWNLVCGSKICTHAR